MITEHQPSAVRIVSIVIQHLLAPYPNEVSGSGLVFFKYTIGEGNWQEWNGGEAGTFLLDSHNLGTREGGDLGNGQACGIN